MSFLKEYTLLDELGRGGFAKVYKVRHNTLGYIRAIRVLNETITDEKSPTYQKFLRECKMLLILGNGNHRNIVHIYQPRLLNNHALVEMDYVDGKDLLHYLNENGNFLPVEEVLRMAEEISSALAYCHEDIYKFCMDPDEDHLESDPIDGSKWLIDEATRQRLIEKYKVIHNDIHSGNIMRREDGSFVLLDFGLAITGDDDVRNSSRHKNGAIEFKAPEKWDDDSILTKQSDIYSFGIVMYQYLAGRVPFPYDTTCSDTEALLKLLKQHKEQQPPRIYDLRKSYYEAKYPGQTYKKDYPDWLENLIRKCLEKDPSKRFSNGKELYNSLMQFTKETEESASKAEIDAVLNTNSVLCERIETLLEELEKAKAAFKAMQEKSGEDTLKKELKKLKEEMDQKYEALVKLVSESKPDAETSSKAPEATKTTDDTPPPPFKQPHTTKDISAVHCYFANGVGFNMIKVVGRSFYMGSQSSIFKRKNANFSQEADADESPVHYVGLSNTYYLGETVVTQSLWKAVMHDYPHLNDPSFFKNDESPVECVSWNDVQLFLSELNRITGMKFRLPTEAEWEFAARSGIYAEYAGRGEYSGGINLDWLGWYSGNSNGSTHPVKLKQCNELGLYDMSGNVSEWCSDWYGNYKDVYQTNPQGPQNGKDKVLRGGSWESDANHCRVSKREHSDPDNRSKCYGFRLALSK